MHICVRHNRDLIPTPPNRYLDSSGFDGEHRVCPPAPRGPPRQHRCPPAPAWDGDAAISGDLGFSSPFLLAGREPPCEHPPKNAGNALGWLRSTPGVPGEGGGGTRLVLLLGSSPSPRKPREAGGRGVSLWPGGLEL